MCDTTSNTAVKGMIKVESPEWGMHALTNASHCQICRIREILFSGDSVCACVPIATVAKRTARGTLIVNTLYML